MTGAAGSDETVDGTQLRRIREALLAAFPSEDALETLLRDRMSLALFNIVERGPLEKVVFDLLVWTEARNQTSDLVRCAYGENPDNVRLRALAVELHLPEPPPQHDRTEGPKRRWWRDRRIVLAAAGLTIVAAAIAGAVTYRRYAEPNFILTLVDGPPAAPVADRQVSIGRASGDGDLSDVEAHKTNTNGEAFFHLKFGSDRIYLGRVDIERAGSVRRCQFPAFSVAEGIRKITHNLADLNCGASDLSARVNDSQVLRALRGSKPGTITLPSLRGSDVGWEGRVPVDLAARQSRAPLGLPVAPTILDHLYYTLGYDGGIHAPRWVSFTVDSKRVLRLPRQLDAFQADPAIPASLQSSAADFQNNPYDRGHLVRRTDVFAENGTVESARAAEREIFHYSAVVPQAQVTNQVTWLAVEDFTTTASAKVGPVFVVAGPIYPQAQAGTMPFLVVGPNRIPVPTMMFRVLLRKTPRGEWRSLAFVVQNDGSRERVARSLAVSVLEVEAKSGLVFFPRLPGEAMRKVKSNRDVDAFLAD